jgi:hypothetical protein
MKNFQKLKTTATSEYRILLNLIALSCVGIGAYVVATRHIFLWVTIAVIIPILLLVVHFAIRPIFVPVFFERRMVLVKYVTFITQNLLLVIFWKYFPEHIGLLMIWIFRLNVLEVLIDLFLHKEYALCIPTLFLLFFTNIQFDYHPTHLIVMTKANWFFIIEYTLWFVAWMATCVPKRFATTIHTLYPLFFAPRLWFSVRTLTGMVALSYAYMGWKFHGLIRTEKYEKQITQFAGIYKQVYLVVFIAMYIHKFFWSSI